MKYLFISLLNIIFYMANTVEIMAKNIKRLRENKKLSQDDLSIKSGVIQAQISRIERGLVEPSISTLEKLANALEVSVSEFFLF